jgi:protein-S-isoprenylcysteine O-methyltransferase Ste14
VVRAGVILYLAGIAFAEALRVRWRVARLLSREYGSRTRGPVSVPEAIVMLALVLGIWVLPFTYAFTDWLRPFDYSCPGWTVWVAGAAFGVGLVIRWFAQRALGRQWSPTLDMAQGHVLVTDGIYGRIRHPLYASLVLWAAAQPFLLQNVIAGWGGAVAALLIWFVRVPREEVMMVGTFGEEYRQYMARTGRLVPRRRA